jgi:hypothetical protein
VTFGELENDAQFIFVDKTVHDKLTSHVGPFTKTGYHQYTNDTLKYGAKADFMVATRDMKVEPYQKPKRKRE